MDFAFRVGRLEAHSRLVAAPLRHVRPIFCATPSYLRHHGHPRAYQELEVHQLAVLPERYLSKAVKRFLRQQALAFDTDRHHRIDDVETGYQMIKANMCIGMILDCAVESEIAKGELVEIFPDRRAPAKVLYLLYRKSQYQLQRHKLFKEFFKQCYSKSV